jgi:hypothetical protein
MSNDHDDGPACGTAAAETHFLATYNDGTGVHFAERNCCCFRHIPRPADLLPAGAELAEVVIEDGLTRTVVRDGRAEITVKLPAELS